MAPKSKRFQNSKTTTTKKTSRYKKWRQLREMSGNMRTFGWQGVVLFGLECIYQKYGVTLSIGK
jgi:hypothetical protein